MASEPRRPSPAAAYDAVAAAYAETYYGELARKPFDRDVLTAFAAALKGPGQIADIGCGPGQIARFLADLGLSARGLEVLGFDVSPGMIAQARSLNPALRFEVADMRALPLEDGALCGATAFYSLIHLPRAEVGSALRELRRVLRSDSPFLLTFHIGAGETHLGSWFDRPVSLDFTFFGLEEMTGYAEDAGYSLEAVQVRDPYPFEVQTERAYVRLRTPPA